MRNMEKYHTWAMLEPSPLFYKFSRSFSLLSLSLSLFLFFFFSFIPPPIYYPSQLALPYHYLFLFSFFFLFYLIKPLSYSYYGGPPLTLAPGERPTKGFHLARMLFRMRAFSVRGLLGKGEVCSLYPPPPVLSPF